MTNELRGKKKDPRLCAYCGHDRYAHLTLKRKLESHCHVARVDIFGEIILKCPCKKFKEAL